MDRKSASELIGERADLLIRIEEINSALALLENPTKPISINTLQNLRNTYLGDVKVFEDKTLTTLARESDYGGWITAEDAAFLCSEFASDIEGGCFTVDTQTRG